MIKMKNILAFLCLFVFLFPLVESEIHSFAHMNDFHCTDNSYVHFHKADHHCILCDFTADFSTPPSSIRHISELKNLYVLNFFFSENNYLLQPKDFHSLRGPPSVA